MMIMHHLLLSYFRAWENLFIIAQKSLTSSLIPGAIYWCLCVMHQIICVALVGHAFIYFFEVFYIFLCFFVCLFFQMEGMPNQINR